MRFDAYCATVRDAGFSAVVGELAGALGGVDKDFRPMRRYGVTRAVEVGGRMAAWVGQDAASGAIYVEAKGETSPMAANALRVHFPDHTCPRVDVCEDYDEPGAFQQLIGLVREHKGPRVKSGFKELPDDEDDGKTWAAGVRGGVAMVRVYEAGKHPDRVHLGRPDWARLELECRPQYAAGKAKAATMSPADFWGFSAWTHRVGEAATMAALKRIEPVVRHYSHDRTTRYLALTFRRHWQEMIENGEHIQRTLEAVWQEEDEARRQQGRGYGGEVPM